MNSSRRVLRVRIAAAVAGLALGLTGCSVTNPPDVLKVTDPGDGRSAAIGGSQGDGGVKLRNFLVVSQGNGKPGTLVGGISNETGAPVDVQLTVVQTDANGQQTPVGSTTVTVQPSEFVQFGPATGTASGTASPTGAVSPSPSVSASPGSTPSPPPSVSGSTSLTGGPATGRVITYQIPTVPQPPGAVIQLFAQTSEGGAKIDMPILPPVGDYARFAPVASSSATSSPSPTASPGGTPNPSASPTGSGTPTPSGSPSPSS